jgi:hypothetical protein
MRTLVTLVLVAACAALSGCASSGPVSRPMHDSSSLAGYQKDHNYMAQVESVARTRRVEVRWVNPPRVRDRR